MVQPQALTRQQRQQPPPPSAAAAVWWGVGSMVGGLQYGQNDRPHSSALNLVSDDPTAERQPTATNGPYPSPAPPLFRPHTGG